MNKISVVIITHNEEDNIARCIDSVKNIADEVIVLDSMSTDRTIEIARQCGASVFLHPFEGYMEQKNKVLTYAAHDYVFSIDADEALSETLEASILTAKQSLSHPGYHMNRCTCYCGKFIHHGSWYPDQKIRLFDRRIAYWGGMNPHDRLEFRTPQKTEGLKGDILHYSYNTLEEHIAQNNRFSTIAAEAGFKAGKRAGWRKIIVNPFWAFFKSYILRQGFRDGYRGYVIARNISHLTFMKYYKLYALQKGILVR